ncbi:hypothetical protein OD91_0168 [Lutibacter sp. Hel_I_33_5]|uniref:hypothetical protein n=1 Tax=Lutibacter sp. Hel_I_33_5 TaxID=1566289 RepID=UPI0011A196BB|nr:hypothetical protein [Lutibacter sp. Hel_I_33_5]TVZ54930.1 hypothetical protein OD91_0168 [Lutibacter sp. Hel_I_33_5]
MELANIEKLVKKYLNAETTLQEEATLRNYFLSNNVAPHLEEYTMLFSYFQSNKDETFTKTIELESKKSKRKNFKWLSVAASVVLLLSVYVGNAQYKEYQQRKTFAEVQKALKMLSVNLKKGDKAVASLYTYENTVHKIFKTK